MSTDEEYLHFLLDYYAIKPIRLHNFLFCLSFSLVADELSFSPQMTTFSNNSGGMLACKAVAELYSSLQLGASSHDSICQQMCKADARRFKCVSYSLVVSHTELVHSCCQVVWALSPVPGWAVCTNGLIS